MDNKRNSLSTTDFSYVGHLPRRATVRCTLAYFSAFLRSTSVCYIHSLNKNPIES